MTEEEKDRARLKVTGGRPSPEFGGYYSFGWKPVAKTKASEWEGPRDSVEEMRRMFEGFGYAVKEL